MTRAHLSPARSSPSPTSLAQRYHDVRARTLALVAPLSPEDCVVQSMPDASPAKWHLAHTTWFFETFVLAEHASGYVPFDASYKVLFNSYYNAVGERHPRPQRGLLSRPSLESILAYRDHVDTAMLALLGRSDASRALVELGLQHEQQHQELIVTDVKHLLSCNPTHPAYLPAWPLTPVVARQPQWIAHAGGIVEAGARGDTFAFDNELPRHATLLRPFEISSHPVSHGEFAAFIDDDGYRRPELWLSLGWETVVAQRWDAPLYWERRDDAWWTYTLRGMAPIDADAPVTHISYFEADAFARWAGKHLPTEQEWEVAVRQGALGDAYGIVWQWTRSAYSPYPGFVACDGALGEYNGKFMINQMLLRGASVVTPPGHSRKTYRNLFHPHLRWQFTGIRLAR